MARHFTASVFVIHAGRVLLLLHREKRLWLPPGGHVEAEETPAEAAVREALEETGLAVVLTSPRFPAGRPPAEPRPEASLQIEVAPGHFHMDLVYYGAPAAGSDPAGVRPNEEAVALHWWSPAEIAAGRPRGTVAAYAEARLPADVAALARDALERARLPRASSDPPAPDGASADRPPASRPRPGGR